MKKIEEKTAECQQKDTENARLLTKVGSLTAELKQKLQNTKVVV